MELKIACKRKIRMYVTIRYYHHIKEISPIALTRYVMFPRIFVFFFYVHCLGSVTAVYSIKHIPFPLFDTRKDNVLSF